MPRLRGVALLGVGCLLAGCIDAIQSPVSPGPEPGEDLEIAIPGFSRMGAPAPGTAPLLSTAPDGVPPEFEAETSVESAWIMLSITSTEARADAFMTYIASHAEQTLNLAITDGETSLAAPPVVTMESSLFPWTRSLHTTSALPVPKECGWTAIANSQNKAWNQTVLVNGMVTWGEKNVPVRKQASQPQCQTDVEVRPEGDEESFGGGDTGIDSGGGGGTEVDTTPVTYTCHWTFEYNPDTGEILRVLTVVCFPDP